MNVATASPVVCQIPTDSAYQDRLGPIRPPISGNMGGWTRTDRPPICAVMGGFAEGIRSRWFRVSGTVDSNRASEESLRQQLVDPRTQTFASTLLDDVPYLWDRNDQSEYDSGSQRDHAECHQSAIIGDRVLVNLFPS
jgi:hypothetical protein